jgi:hypothetical protein
LVFLSFFFCDSKSFALLGSYAEGIENKVFFENFLLSQKTIRQTTLKKAGYTLL